MEQWAGEEEDLLVEVQKKYGPSDAWARAPQPTDLASQQRVLIAAYAEWDDSKSAEDVLGIIDKRRGEEPELPAEEWRLRSSLSVVTALSAGALGTELPAEGARLVLTPHALFRIRAPLLPPSLTSKLATDFDVSIPGFRK